MCERSIDRLILDALHPVSREGSSYEGETKKCLTTRTILIHYLKPHSTVEDLERKNVEKMKLNVPGRQKKLGRYKSSVKQAQHPKLYSDLPQV